MKEPFKNILAVIIGLSLILLIEVLLMAAGVSPLKDRDPFVGFEGSNRLFVRSPDRENTYILNPSKEKYFNPRKFQYPKPDGTFRVVSFGGSTTFGRPYINDTSFPSWFSGMLNNAQNSIRFENINVGGISYASYRIKRLMEEMSGFSPDLYILYAGHNEFLEARTFEEIIKEPEPKRVLRTILHRSRIYTVINDLLTSTATEKGDELHEDVQARLEVIGGYELYRRDEAFTEGVTTQFRDSLAEIIEFCRKKDIPLILCTLTSNLTGISPFKSQHRGDLTRKELADWNSLFEAARDEEAGNNYQEALKYVLSAERIDDLFADQYFFKGKILMRLGRVAEARESFIRARDEDIVPLRALESFNKSIRELAEEHDVPLADVETAFREAAPNGLPGNELFVDHVHPTIKGQQLIAWTLLNTAVDNNLLPGDPVPEKEFRKRALDYLQTAYSRITPRYRAMGHWGVGRLYHWAGKYQEARNSLNIAWKSIKDIAEIPYLLGDLELLRRNPQHAFMYFEEARRIGGEEVRTAYGIAKAALQLRDGAMAIRVLETIPPTQRDAVIHPGLSGEGLLLTEDTDGAIRNLKEAVSRVPDSRRFLYSLTRAYILAGDEPLAKDIFNRYADLSGISRDDFGEFRRITLDDFKVREQRP